MQKLLVLLYIVWLFLACCFGRRRDADVSSTRYKATMVIYFWCFESSEEAESVATLSIIIGILDIFDHHNNIVVPLSISDCRQLPLCL